MWTIEAEQDQLGRLSAEWEALLRRNGDDRPFMHAGWFACCLETYGRESGALLLAVRQDGDLCAVVPLWRRRRNIRGIHVRTLEFVHSPDSPFVDFIVDGAKRDQALHAVLDYLLAERWRSWDVCRLERWPADSPNMDAVRRELQRRRRRFAFDRSAVLPSLRIEGEWEEFLQRQSPKYRKTHRNIVNRMRKLGGIEVERHKADPDGRILEDVVRVSGKSWKHAKAIGIGSTPVSLGFFSRLTRLADERGWLLIWLVKKDGEPIAMEYDIEHNGVVYALRSDFDQEFREVSPGAYLQTHILEALFDGDYREYNAGPGLDEYKRRTTGQTSENLTLTLFGATWRGRAAWLAEALASRLRRVKHGLKREQSA